MNETDKRDACAGIGRGCAGQQAPPEQLTEMEKNDQRNNFIGLTPEQKQEDFAYLCETLDTLYPFWGELAEQEIEKEQLFAAYRERVEQTSSDISFLNEIGQLFKELQGRHNMPSLFDEQNIVRRHGGNLQ